MLENDGIAIAMDWVFVLIEFSFSVAHQKWLCSSSFHELQKELACILEVLDSLGSLGSLIFPN